MELRVEILYDDIQGSGRKSDEILRDIQRRMGSEAVWEKYHDGWKVVN
jgi:hypothetical protein